jgi:hypothetical protein
MPKVKVERRAEMPPCSRCATPVVISSSFPIGDIRVPLELCPSCDAGDSAGGRVLDLLDAGEAGRSSEELAGLARDWVRESIEARGWRYMPHPPVSAN